MTHVQRPESQTQSNVPKCPLQNVRSVRPYYDIERRYCNFTETQRESGARGAPRGLALGYVAVSSRYNTGVPC